MSCNQLRRDLGRLQAFYWLLLRKVQLLAYYNAPFIPRGVLDSSAWVFIPVVVLNPSF